MDTTQAQTNPTVTPPQDFDGDYGSLRTTRIPAHTMLPLNPYVSNVKLKLSDIPEEQEPSKLLIADLLTNEVAAARIESFAIEYSCTGILGSGK